MQLVVVGVPLGVRNVILACWDWEKLEHFQMRTSLEAGAKTFFRQTKEFGYTSFFLPWVGEYWCRAVRIEFFWSVFQVSSWRFSRVALLLKRLHLGSKSDLTTNRLIFEILLGYALFRRCIISVDWNFQQLLKVVSFWRRQLIPIVCLNVFSCVLWIFPYFWAIRFCNIDWWF